MNGGIWLCVCVFVCGTTSPNPHCSGGIGGGGCCQTTGCQTFFSGCGIQSSTEWNEKKKQKNIYISIMWLFCWVWGTQNGKNKKGLGVVEGMNIQINIDSLLTSSIGFLLHHDRFAGTRLLQNNFTFLHHRFFVFLEAAMVMRKNQKSNVHSCINLGYQWNIQIVIKNLFTDNFSSFADCWMVLFASTRDMLFVSTWLIFVTESPNFNPTWLASLPSVTWVVEVKEEEEEEEVEEVEIDCCCLNRCWTTDDRTKSFSSNL